jgi:hypothetical protein
MEQKVNNYIESLGFTLVSDYATSTTFLDIYCPTCEQNFSVQWATFANKKRGGQCTHCRKEKNRKLNITPFAQVKSEFESMGYTLLIEPDEYRHKDQALLCRCPCGKETRKRRRDMLSGQQCMTCGAEARGALNRITNTQADKIADNTGLNIVTYSLNQDDPVEVECQTCKFQFTSTLTSIKHQNTGCRRCRKSYGEHKLLTFIEKYPNISYKTEYIFPHDPTNGSPSCRYKDYMRFDLWIEPFDGHEMIIEIDGIQHFQPIEYFGGQKTFEERRKKDIIKSKYCYDNNIPLLRIHHKDLDNLVEVVIKFIRKYRYNKKGSGLMYSDIDKYKELIDEIGL